MVHESVHNPDVYALQEMRHESTIDVSYQNRRTGYEVSQVGWGEIAKGRVNNYKILRKDEL